MFTNSRIFNLGGGGGKFTASIAKLACAITLLTLTQSHVEAQSLGQFRIRNDDYIQIGYDNYKVLSFGAGMGQPNEPNNGALALEYWREGLNFWCPWPNPMAANYLLFIHRDGNVGINTDASAAEKLWIGGDLRVNSTFYASDERFKKQLKPIEAGLKELMLLRPKQYYFNTDLNGSTKTDSVAVNVTKQANNYNFDNKLHFGLSAQEVQKLFPHLVSADDKGFLALNYVEIIPLLINAIQEQQMKIDDLEKRINTIKK